MNSTSSPPPLPLALDASQLAAIQRASELHRPLRRARTYAIFEAWTLALFGVVTLITGYSSFSALFIGLALCCCAAVEFRSTRLLSSLDRRGPVWLARNQLILAICLIIYAAWNLIDAHLHPTHMLRDVDASLSDFDSLEQTITTWIYITLIIIAVIFQGSTALFYLSRRKHLQRYLDEVPEWARTLQR